MRALSRLVAAVVLTAAASAVLPNPPASATACSSDDGVTVVVDFHELGGGLQQVCDAAGAGKAAAAQFAESGFALTRVQRQPGFVCRVNGAPSEDPCVNTPPSDAYWGLWWSDGTSGSWSYASQGVDSLTVPEGGYVALSWNDSSTKSPPGTAPAVHPADPTPSPSSPAPSSPSGGGPDPSSGGGATGGAAPTAGATASAQGSDDPTADPSATRSTGPGDGQKGRRDKHRGSGPSASASTTGAAASPGPDPAASSADPAEPSEDGLPPWVAPVGIAVLFATAAGTAVVRRRRGTAGP